MGNGNGNGLEDCTRRGDCINSNKTNKIYPIKNENVYTSHFFVFVRCISYVDFCHFFSLYIVFVNKYVLVYIYRCQSKVIRLVILWVVKPLDGLGLAVGIVNPSIPPRDVVAPSPANVGVRIRISPSVLVLLAGAAE